MSVMMSFDQFVTAFEKLQLRPLAAKHKISRESRLVHDLGIAGDDLDEFLQILDFKELTPVQVSKLRVSTPSETSHDAYLVAMARSWLAMRFPPLASYFVRRVKAPPLTVGEFLELVSDQSEM